MADRNPLISWGKLNAYQSSVLVDQHTRGVKVRTLGKVLILRNLPKNVKSDSTIKNALGEEPGRIAYLTVYPFVFVVKKDANAPVSSTFQFN